ncbi:single-stranded DNA-binding protein [Pseudobacillus badius]|uniref:single-stranded DNA-binding protein n=1 Tax=Bacillus badius TaxID=1455 RepID=UPI0007B09193|nr:single-stranded DNA-binding protein [Bacillus badius]KZN99963.1 single-stranded DNA-binding protein [Bacillus badius]MED0665980.1 single-stranded DNA-binding protein [Bacillus badius]OCS86130.1 single-stranded DNA-binding protein [Bacillus badius]OVE52409.1 single-stranded DNA-binding protein [Bacillus badius]TDW04148.1 single-strand DNA-binding protein [Bacillus badius]
MINQVTLVGRLTKDPVVKYTSDGRPLLNMTVAVNRPYRNQEGVAETDFIYCTVWNKSAENTAKYCKKGSLVGVLGTIQTRNYEDETRKKVYVTEVNVHTVRFMDKKRSEPSSELLPILTVP